MGKKIVGYKLVGDHHAFNQDFESAVMQLINDGWDLYGNPLLNNGYLTQVMVKYGE